MSIEKLIDTCKSIVDSQGNLLAVFVATVVILFLVKAILSFIKVRKKLALIDSFSIRSHPKRIMEVIKNNNLNKNDFVIIDSQRDYAATVGLLRAKIVLSTAIIGKLDYHELEAVVLHELYHKKNSHGMLLVAGEVAAGALFFLPVLKDLIHKTHDIFETQADRFAKKQQMTGAYLSLAFSKVGGTNKLDVYPNFQNRPKHNIKKVNVALSVFSLFLLLAFLSLPQKAAAEGSGRCTRSITTIQNMTSAFQSRLQNY